MHNPKEYFALSYQWGDAVSVTTTTRNFEEHCEEIQIDKLCWTFQDAIAVTRILGFEHLWIDALCIVQDTADKDEEIPVMDQIYNGAVLTLAASQETSAKDGLSIRPPRSTKVALPYRDQNDKVRGEFYVTLRDSKDIDSDIGKGALSRRAWCMQERICSTRILHFTADQAIWECPSVVRCETTALPLDLNHDKVHRLRGSVLAELGKGLAGTIPASKDQISMFLSAASYEPAESQIVQIEDKPVYGVWYSLVSQYTTRAMKFDTDKLPALAGTARKFSDIVRKDKYVAGLWRDDIHAGILWTASGAFSIFERHYFKKPSQSRAPTWSWASLDGGVTYPMGRIFHYCIDVLSVHVKQSSQASNNSAAEAAGRNQSSPALEGRLRLLGRILPMEDIDGIRPNDIAHQNVVMFQNRSPMGPDLYIPWARFDLEEEYTRWVSAAPTAGAKIALAKEYALKAELLSRSSAPLRSPLSSKAKSATAALTLGHEKKNPTRPPTNPDNVKLFDANPVADHKSRNHSSGSSSQLSAATIGNEEPQAPTPPFYALLVAIIGCGSQKAMPSPCNHDHLICCRNKLGYALLLEKTEEQQDINIVDEDAIAGDTEPLPGKPIQCYRRIGVAQVKFAQFFSNTDVREIVII